MYKAVTMLIGFALIVSLAACTSREEINSFATQYEGLLLPAESTSRPSVMSTPVTMDSKYNGSWGGLASDGDSSILFGVENGAIQFLIADTFFPECGSVTFTAFYPQPVHIVVDDTFSVAVSDLTVEGTFESDSSASGSFEIAPFYCRETVAVEWNAEPFDLGDYSITPPELESLFPDAAAPVGTFSPQAAIQGYGPSTYPLTLYSKYDWGLVTSNMAEVVVPIPTGWIVIESMSGETYLLHGEGDVSTQSPIEITLGATGFRGDNKTSEEIIADFEEEIGEDQDVKLLMKEIVDDDKGYLFLSSVAHSHSGPRYLLLLFSRDPSGYFHAFTASVDQGRWDDYYPIVEMMVDKWTASSDFSPLGMALPETPLGE